MREPTVAEKLEIAEYLQSICGDNTEPEYGTEMVERSWIGVADHFVSDGPGYVGRVIAVIYPAGPEVHDILYYGQDGKLVRAVSEREVDIREELRPKTNQEIHDEDEDIERLFDDLRGPKEGDEWTQKLN